MSFARKTLLFIRTFAASRRHKSTLAAHRLGFEALESRVLMSATFDALSGALTVTGSEGNDQIVLTAGVNAGEVLVSGAGVADGTLFTGVSSVLVYGLGGNDRIAIGQGLRHGGSGEALGVYAAGHEGNDSITGGTGNDTLVGGEGHDRIIDLLGDNVIDAGNGNNVVTTGPGNDRVILGAGNDRLVDSGGDNSIDAGAGHNRVTLGGGNDYLVSGSGVDRITDAGGDNTIFAGDGNNRIRTGGGNDLIVTGYGHSRIGDTGGSNSIFASGGNNRIGTAGASLDFIWTGGGNDVIATRGGNNEVSAGDGKNRIAAGAGNDQVVAGIGNDLITDRGGANYIDAGPGKNRVRGSGGVAQSPTDLGAIDALANTFDQLRLQNVLNLPQPLADALDALSNRLDQLTRSDILALPVAIDGELMAAIRSLNAALQSVLDRGFDNLDGSAMSSLTAFANRLLDHSGVPQATDTPVPPDPGTVADTIIQHIENIYITIFDLTTPLPPEVRTTINTIVNNIFITLHDAPTDTAGPLLEAIDQTLATLEQALADLLTQGLGGAVLGTVLGLVDSLQTELDALIGNVTSDPTDFGVLGDTIINLNNEVINAASVLGQTLTTEIEQAADIAYTLLQNIQPVVNEFANALTQALEQIIGDITGNVQDLSGAVAAVTEQDLAFIQGQVDALVILLNTILPPPPSVPTL